MRVQHYSYRTEKTYIYWIKQYIVFHGIKHPNTMGADELNAFLTHLAVDKKVTASTQNQAFCAILFLYRQVLEKELPKIENVSRAKRPEHLPVVFTVDEVKKILSQLRDCLKSLLRRRRCEKVARRETSGTS
jgi:site-specific recombinase XerD